MTTGAIETGVTHYGRSAFLALPWELQKQADLRKVFDTSDQDVNLTANCIYPGHRDTDASMVIYSNGVWCFGCKTRMWPDQFLRSLGDLPLHIERGARKQPAPKFIPFGQVRTYSEWLWAPDGYYCGRQQWLLGRGLIAEYCSHNYIGHTGEAYSIPIFGEGVGVRSIRYRRDDELASEDRPKYWGTAGANDAMLYIPRTSPALLKYGLMLCEGELDALRLAQEGYAAVSLTNGCNALKEEHIPQLRGYASRLGTKQVSVCYDQDAPGLGAGAKAYLLLGQAGMIPRHIVWRREHGKDVTELLQSWTLPTFAKLLERIWLSD
jgi:hypothetical protein